jgi:ATP-binding cassette subfamily B protein
MMNMKLFRYALALSIGLVMASWSLSSGAAHAIALFGEPKYPAQFSHFEYANPNAPKGGTLNLATVSLNSNFGILLAFLLYMDQFFAPLQQLSGVFDQWIQARVSFRRLQELLQTHSSTPEPEAPIEPGVLEGKVRFEAVRFSYGPQNPEALRGVDLEIQPGEQVSLVGTTGAGKSTFVKLAARFYDPSAGSVSVDGIPLPQLALQGFRRQIGYVPQEAFLFSGTVRSNIAYGKPDATDLEVERAARAAGAHEFICRLSRGYLTPVSARGRTLSAGQRQLICLARVALIDPRILILDEATAKLDLETEAHVKQAVKRVAHGRTTLIIAHRLQTARHADRILVLDDGRIVESGSHERLLAVPGRYQRLWQDFTDAQGRPS